MAFPSIDVEEVGNTGLFWLFFSYGYVLYFASNMISEGSDLLLLIPSMAGLVGGVVLPLLGAVPDGAIMLFSGLGDIESAQETLSVGVGALAGSTIMLLTIPWALSIYAGRVDIGPDGKPNYFGKPKLSLSNANDYGDKTGVSISPEVSKGGLIMMVTLIPYFMIQGAAMFIHGPTEVVAAGEKYWALAGLIICLTGFFTYLYMQVQASNAGMDRLQRVQVMKKLMQEGAVSLRGALRANIAEIEMKSSNISSAIENQSYGAVDVVEKPTDPSTPNVNPPPEVRSILKDVLGDAFQQFDTDGNGTLSKKEVKIFLHDFHEAIDDSEVDKIFAVLDVDSNGVVDFDEFIGACYYFIVHEELDEDHDHSMDEVDKEGTAAEFADKIFSDQEGEGEEEEEMPEDIIHLSPEEQQKAIKMRALRMLTIGTGLVILFSDPMVDVMQEIATRMGLSPFYVSFILAPLASNASEVIASQYYASKKTRKTISVSFAALEGAAAMMNTFCLSIFMGLIYWRGLAWQYTAETIAIVAVELILSILVQREVMTMKWGLIVFSLFPMSLVLVATLEAYGFD
eukprot:CAMPEP_0195289426 /NCGR_PEP_ID=MMETSP0707-20130614/5707_1 /TAXON_ID=33640 /ORGANISM="Asterionellopsis glacialis, Strain CCMP134" /LENGTH=568 /DNA_ID=CAMNT_0040349427 /DNA_START=70 /DNA_END=1776 /DNA_ORIENTATION=-